MNVSYRQLRVGPHLVGLDELFAALHAAGRPAEAALVPELLAGARRENFVPVAAEALYGEALLRAYAGSLQESARRDPVPCAARTWRGLPREQVPWFPTVYADRCDGCGRCLAFCPNSVYALTADGAKVEVAAPLACVVGCSACTAICP